MQRALGVVAPYVLLAVVPAALWITGLALAAGRGALSVDYHTYFDASRDVLAGRAPHTPYPALTSVAYVPLALLPRGAGGVILTLLLTGCAVGVLRVLGVRDWRCYGAAALWNPTYSAVQTGNVSLFLALGVALLWRWRDRPVRAGLVVALVVALKLFLWPLLLWLVLTRRWRALAVSVATAGVASSAAWAVVGFGTLSHFPAALRANLHVTAALSYTVSGLLRGLGAGALAADLACWAVGAAVLVTAGWLAWRGEERRSLSVFLLAALILSPVVWTHYLVLLLIPVALASPTFSALWLAPIVLLVCPPVGGSSLDKALALITETGVTALATWGRWGARVPSRRRAPARRRGQVALAEPALLESRA
jgi:hypothetical protein